MNRQALEFRPDIEGLRGVAVLLVLFAHAGVPGFEGGFVGVDMFFVISGYLITRLLRRELAATGRVDLAAFFARRMKRLLPALLLMLVSVAIACRWLLPVGLQAEAAQSGYWAALWVSNIQFAVAQLAYFDDAAQQNVFTHTWSLGVEEQFYLIWPLLLAVAWKARADRLPVFALVVGVASLLLCLWLAGSDANAAYYLMPTRLWQLAAGACAGLWVWPRRRWPVFGAALLVVAMLVLDENRAYPSPWALLPVASAVLLLQPHPGSAWVSRALASPPLRFFGRISYSLYLWHWPILVLAGIALPLGGVAAVSGAILLSIVVATLSERWIERPIRHAGLRNHRALASGLAASLPVAILIAAWQSSVWSATPGLIPSRPPQAEENLLANRISVPQVYKVRGFDQNYESDRFMPVATANARSASGQRVLLAGDSVLMQWEPAVTLLARSRGWRLVAATKSACPMVDAPYVNPRIRRRFEECERWRRALVEHVRSTRPDILILGSASTYQFDDAAWVAGTRSLLSELHGHAGRVVLLSPPPLLPFRPLDCVFARGKLVAGKLEAEGCSAPLAQSRREKVARLLGEAVRGRPDVILVNLDGVVCPAGECSAVWEGQLVFRDPSHLNAAFVVARYGELARLFDRLGIR